MGLSDWTSLFLLYGFFVSWRLWTPLECFVWASSDWAGDCLKALAFWDRTTEVTGGFLRLVLFWVLASLVDR